MGEGRVKARSCPRVWLYAHTSSGEKSSLKRQLKELTDWAAQNDCEIVGSSCECAFPALFWRPGLRAMLRAVRREEVDMVVVTRLSRLGRKKQHLSNILSTLKKHNVGLITIEADLRYQLYLHGLDTRLAKPIERKAADHLCPTT